MATDARRISADGSEWLWLALAVAGFAAMLLPRLGYPLLWQDEAETAMYATRIVEYGFPKVHGERNVVYEFGRSIAQGVNERFDAFIGTTWGDFYFAVPGVLWARSVRDFHARTWRLRLPFALAGGLGVALLAAAVAPAFGDRRRRLRFAALYFALAAVSISLVLHLRELRYYPLLVLAIAALLFVHLRYAVFERLAYSRYVAALALLLVLLFQVFFAAWFACVALLALERGHAAWRRPGPAGPGWRGAARDLAPLAASAVLLLPAFAFFETFQLAGAWSRDLGLSPGRYAANLGWVLVHFARHELLLAALAARAARGLLDARRAPPPAGAAARRCSAFLAFFAAGYALIGCANPLVYERYFVVLSPVLTALFLLEAALVLEQLRAGDASGRAARAGVAALAALVGLTLVLRAPEIRGRIDEIREPRRGPLDHAMAHLSEAYERPEQLVIATNYEAQPFMYYLGSHAIVGLSHNNIRRERALVPDVVIPRRRWSRGLPELRRFLAAGSYVLERLPVRDLHYNQIPALSRSRWIPDPHRFGSAETRDPEQQLELYRRVEPGAELRAP